VCFSAGASFAGGAVISAIGVAAQTQVSKPAQRLFAVIPFFFGFQQFAEGVLWITMGSGKFPVLQDVVTYIFLVTALVIWPSMVPLSVRLMEERKLRKRILTVILIAGYLLSCFYAFCLFYYDIFPRINGFHIEYIYNVPQIYMSVAFVFYLITTITPFFISSVKRMWLFGVLIAVSCIVTGIFFSQYLTSVWCFFAAIISIIVYWILRVNKPKAVTSARS
jgi:urea transporter